MNAKVLILVLIVIAAGVGLYYLTQTGDDVDIYDEGAMGDEALVDPNPNSSEGSMTVTVTGVIASIDNSGVALDGPTLITTTESGTAEEAVIAVPSFGRNLCKAAITDPATLSVGDVIEVRGDLDENGHIVPCLDDGHYIRLAA